MPSAKQIAEKTLACSPNFHFRENLATGHTASDAPFGVYLNEDDSNGTGVLFAALGIYLPPSQNYVPYKEIAEVALPDKYVMNEPGKRVLGLTLRDGRRAEMPICGERNQAYDIYHVDTFLFKVRAFAKNW